MEIWKDIPGTGGQYQVSDTGNVRSFITLKNGEVKSTALKSHKDQKGYSRIKFTVQRSHRTIKVHREVAIAFIPNPHKLPQVNHKNGIKTDNCVDNLEWVTNIENAHHAIANGFYDDMFAKAVERNELLKKPVIATNKTTGEETRYESVSEAERIFNTRHICAVIKGARNTAKGHTFRYA